MLKRYRQVFEGRSLRALAGVHPGADRVADDQPSPLALLSSRLLRFVAAPIYQPSRQDYLDLLRNEIVPGEYRPTALERDVLTVRERPAQIACHEQVAFFKPSVIRRVGEGERQDAIIDQVLTVDASKALGKDDSQAEVARRHRGVLARGSLTVIVAGDDRMSAPVADRARSFDIGRVD